MKKRTIIILLVLMAIISSCTQDNEENTVLSEDTILSDTEQYNDTEIADEEKLPEEEANSAESLKDNTRKLINNIGKYVKEKAPKVFNEENKDKIINKLDEVTGNINSNIEANLTNDWDSNTAPNYYEVLGKATQETNEVIPQYTKDNIGRPLKAEILLTYETIEREKSEKRENISNINPIGMEYNEKVIIEHPDGSTYKGYFYNRSHMIADSLGGDAIEDNLITGTRSQNVGSRSNQGGMAYSEIKARDFFKTYTKETLSYVVTNYYNEGELIPRYSIIDVKSSDNTINESIKVWNVANGFDINYKTGEFTKK